MAQRAIPDDPELIAFRSLAELGALFVAGSVTPSQATDLCFARIDRQNPGLNAFLHLDLDGAREAARLSTARWAAGRPLSAMDGVPIGVKANIAVRGLPWHAGIAAYRDRIALRDADCVASLRRAGAVVLGVLNMHEAALGATTDNLAFGRCQNPYRHGFTPGGSSGGSAAAVASGLCTIALGTDTMGSVRIPASYCGVFGHIPTVGAIAMEGVIPLSWNLDRIGVIARSSSDIQTVTQVLSGGSGSPAVSGVSSHLTVGVLDIDGWADIDDEVAAAFDRLQSSATSMGLGLRSVKLPSYDIAALRRLSLLVAEVEAVVVHAPYLADFPLGFSPALTAMLRWAERQTAPKLAAAYRHLSETARQIKTALSGLDALLLPTTGTPAFAFDAPPPVGQADFTLPANIAGFAATAFPIGLDRTGLPLSGQFMGADGAATLALAARMARAMDPPLLGR